MDPNQPPLPGYPHPGPPIMMQPNQVQPMPMQTTNTSTTVVVGGATSGPIVQGQTDFRAGLCGCFDDFSSCCVVTLLCWFGCIECYGCNLSKKMDESCFLCGCVPGYLIALRTKLRTERNIRGNICNDCVVTTCCRPCAMCQMAREIDYY